MELIEYRVRPVMRYVVTRFEDGCKDGPARSSVETLGEYDNGHVAYTVGYALCKAEHDRLGWPTGDERIQYPRPLDVGERPECQIDPSCIKG